MEIIFSLLLYRFSNFLPKQSCFEKELYFVSKERIGNKRELVDLVSEIYAAVPSVGWWFQATKWKFLDKESFFLVRHCIFHFTDNKQALKDRERVFLWIDINLTVKDHKECYVGAKRLALCRWECGRLLKRRKMKGNKNINHFSFHFCDTNIFICFDL